jgi:hypothetical protein
VLVGQHARKSGGLAPTPPKTSRNNMAITIGLISEKAWKRGSPGATSYTAERLFGPKYYGDDEARMHLEEVANYAFWWQCASTR